MASAADGPLRDLPFHLFTQPALADEAPSSQSAQALYERAAAALRAKNTPLAVTELESLITSFPTDPLASVAAVHLAECHLALGKPEAADQLLDNWLPKLNQASTNSNDEARALLLHAQWLQACAQLAFKHPQEAKNTTLVALSKFNSNEACSAAEQPWIDRLRTLDKKLEQVLQQLQAQRLRTAAEQVQAKAYAAALNTLEPCPVDALPAAWRWRYQLILAQCHLGQGRAVLALNEVDAIELQQLTVAEQTAVHWVMLDAALAAAQVSRAQQEVDALKTFVATDDDLAATVALRDVELAMLRKDRSAVRTKVAAAKQAYPNFSRRHEFDLLLARNAIAEVQFIEARQILQAIINAAPDQDPSATSRAHWLIAETYFLAQDYAAAISAYTAVVQTGIPSEWLESALLQRGKCFEQQGDLSAATQDYQRIVQSFPQSRLAASAANRLTELEASLRSASKSSSLPQR